MSNPHEPPGYVPDDTRQQPPDPQLDDNHWHKTAMRHAFNQWDPKSMTKARDFSQECLVRAEMLAEVLVQAAWREEVTMSQLRTCAELLADLCHLAYVPTMDWWDDDAELARKGLAAPSQGGPAMTSHRPDRPDAKTPKDLHNAAEDHLQRGTALAKVLQMIIFQHELVSDPTGPFTLENLETSELRIMVNVMCDELDLANEMFGQLAPRGE
jgi:hypothetical protein